MEETNTKLEEILKQNKCACGFGHTIDCLKRMMKLARSKGFSAGQKAGRQEIFDAIEVEMKKEVYPDEYHESSTWKRLKEKFGVK